MAYGEPHANEPNPRQSALAEVSVVAASLMVNGFWEAIDRLPTPDDFDDGDLASLWTCILDARERDGRVTRMGVARELRANGWAEDRAFGALTAAQEAYCTLPEARTAVTFLLDRRLRRAAAARCQETANELATTADVHGAVQRHEKAMAAIAAAADGGGDSWVQLGEVAEHDVERIATGIDDLDRVTGGLPVGTVTVIGARTGMGKTALATCIMRSVASNGYAVGANSLEMLASELRTRMACDQAWRPASYDFNGATDNPNYINVVRGKLTPAHRARYDEAVAEIGRLPIYIDDKKERTLSQIRLGARRLKQRAKREGRTLKLLVIDHLMLVKSDGKAQNRHLDLASMTAEALIIAGEIEVAVVLLCQLSRKVEDRTDKAPMLSDLRESGSIEENADTIILLHRPAYYDERAKMRGEKVDSEEARKRCALLELHVAKNRGGAPEKVDVFVDIGANAIRDKNRGGWWAGHSSQEDML